MRIHSSQPLRVSAKSAKGPHYWNVMPSTNRLQPTPARAPERRPQPRPGLLVHTVPTTPRGLSVLAALLGCERGILVGNPQSCHENVPEPPRGGCGVRRRPTHLVLPLSTSPVRDRTCSLRTAYGPIKNTERTQKEPH